MFKTGDKAILKISFEMVERGGDYTFDDHEDVERHVRGDMVEILRVIDNKTDKRKHDKLAVIYNPKTFASTTVAINHLEPIKGEININVPVKIEVDAKKIEKGTLGSCDMKATGVRTYLKIHRYTLAECCDQITK
ncbi:TPA: hypothetical protein QCR55_005353 [Bacillus cereus]|nr:hypothetical protein [Bacillus cereus]HDR4880382.1 hypothetical protein [Bacillus cereus]